MQIQSSEIATDGDYQRTSGIRLQLTTSELAERSFAVNHKVVQSLHRNWHLSVIKRVRPPKSNSIRNLLKEAGSRINLVMPLKAFPVRYYYHR